MPWRRPPSLALCRCAAVRPLLPPPPLAPLWPTNYNCSRKTSAAAAAAARPGPAVPGAPRAVRLWGSLAWACLGLPAAVWACKGWTLGPEGRAGLRRAAAVRPRNEERHGLHSVHGLHGVHSLHGLLGVHGLHGVHGVHGLHGVHGADCADNGRPRRAHGWRDDGHGGPGGKGGRGRSGGARTRPQTSRPATFFPGVRVF